MNSPLIKDKPAVAAPEKSGDYFQLANLVGINSNFDPYAADPNQVSTRAVGKLTIPGSEPLAQAQEVVFAPGKLLTFRSEDVRADIAHPQREGILVSGPSLQLETATPFLIGPDGDVTTRHPVKASIPDALIQFPGEPQHMAIRFNRFPIVVNAGAKLGELQVTPLLAA